MIRKAIALAVLAAAVPSIVHGQDSAQHGRYFSCEAGDCNNGRGTIVYHVSKNRVTGEWRNGRYVDGVYDVAYGVMPSKTFKVRYGNDGVPREGTLIRGRGVFTGTFSRTSDTFVTEGNDLLPLFRRETVVFRSGRYVDSRGYAYEGEFDYIPLLRTLTTPQYGTTKIAVGVFVFLGVRIDEALDEVKRALFVSEETEPGEQVIFSEASPSYLAKLREELVASRASDAAERAEQARSTREAFNMILGVVGVVATVAVLNKAVSAASDRSVLSTLNRTMSGNEAPSQAARDVASRIEQRNASAGVTGTGRKPASVTVAEYQAAQQRRPEQAPAPSAGTLSGQGNAPVPSQRQSTSTPPRAAISPTNTTGRPAPSSAAQPRATEVPQQRSSGAGTSSSSEPDGRIVLSQRTEPPSHPAAPRNVTKPRQPFAEPDAYYGNGWGHLGAGAASSREAACSEAKQKGDVEKARLSTVFRYDAVSPCVCGVNIGANRSVLDVMAQTGAADQWSCSVYEKKTRIRDTGNTSR